MYEENEKSIFNYNMLFNKINSDNLDEKIDYNTNLISDINLQNFDIKRYEYYTNLLYIYNKDPATLYNLLKKYYNIKNFKSKERKIIKYISNYARLLKDSEEIPDNLIADTLVQEHQGGGEEETAAEKTDTERTAAPKDTLSFGKYNLLYEKIKEALPKKKVLKIKKNYVDKGSPSNGTLSEIEQKSIKQDVRQQKKLGNLLKLLKETSLKENDDKLLKKILKKTTKLTETVLELKKGEEGEEDKQSSNELVHNAMKTGKELSSLLSTHNKDEQTTEQSNISDLLDKTLQIAMKTLKKLPEVEEGGELELKELKELGEEELEEEELEELEELEKEYSHLIPELLPISEEEKKQFMDEISKLEEEVKLKDELEVKLLEKIFTLLSKSNALSSVKYTFTKNDDSANIITCTNKVSNQEIWKINYTNLEIFITEFTTLINTLYNIYLSKDKEKYKKYNAFYPNNEENLKNTKHFFYLSKFNKKYETFPIIKKFYFIHLIIYIYKYLLNLKLNNLKSNQIILKNNLILILKRYINILKKTNLYNSYIKYIKNFIKQLQHLIEQHSAITDAAKIEPSVVPSVELLDTMTRKAAEIEPPNPDESLSAIFQQQQQQQQSVRPNITKPNEDIKEQLKLKLVELNKIFEILQANFESFKFIKTNEIYNINFTVNFNELKNIIMPQHNYNEQNFINFINNLGEHTNELIYNIQRIFNINNDNIIINIKYNNLLEFFSELKIFLNYYFNIYRYRNRRFLDKSTFQKIILDLKIFIDGKNLNDNGLLLEVYIYFRNFINNLIILLVPFDYEKYNILYNELNQDSNYVLTGGTLNDDLKIKYLDTRKYKELVKDSTPLDSYKKDYESDDDDMNKIGQLSEDIDNYYDFKKRNKDKEKDKESDKFIIQQINNFENDPKNPLEELAITFDDRIVFIIATFFIRYITIIMVQWCIDINIIKTFYEGFIYYAIIYIIIFWFIVLFINIDNSFDVKYMNFNGIINTIRTLFYYFYMGTNGITRLLIHTSLIILLIIIPIILNIKNNTEFKDENEDDDVKILNYDERKQLSKSLSLFTMFIWLFTSIIATKF